MNNLVNFSPSTPRMALNEAPRVNSMEHGQRQCTKLSLVVTFPWWYAV